MNGALRASMDIFIQFDKDSKVPLTTQIVDGLRKSIIEGTLKPGYKMPSTRELASSLGLARNTIANAYEQLMSEGLVESLTGSGTYVTNATQRQRASANKVEDPAAYRLSKYAGKLSDQSAISAALISYRLPRRQDLPVDKWHKLTLQHSKHEKDSGPIWCADPLGYVPLRKALADYLQMSRALACSPEQIVLFPSRREALDFWCKVLTEPGEAAAIENPSHPMLSMLLKANGVKIERVCTDEDGLLIDDLDDRNDIRMVFVSPSNDVLNGRTMSLSRRKLLLDWAEKHQAMILEDDFDCEFVLESKDIQQSIQGLDARGNVIYVGSFANALSPLTEQAYSVIPAGLVEITRKAREVFAGCAARLEEKVLSDFIVQGHFARHLRELRSKYQRRRERVLSQLKNLSPTITVVSTSKGTSLLVEIDTTASAENVEICGSKAGLPVVSTAAFGDPENRGGRFLLSYCRVPENDAAQATELFLAYLKEAEITDSKELMLKHGRLSLG